MNDKTLEIFGPTIYARWNAQSVELKDDLTNHLVNIFSDTFDKKEVTSTTGTYLKYMWGQFSVHLQKKTRYEHPMMIPEREWKDLIDYSKEKTDEKEVKTPPGPGRYTTLSSM